MPSHLTARLRALPLLLGFLALGAAVSATLWYTVRQAEDMAALDQAAAIQAGLDDLFSTLQDAETGQRGYLMTGQDIYLVPYKKAVAALDGKFHVLDEAMRGQGGRMDLLDQLHRALTYKVAELAETVALKRAGKDAEAMEVVKTDAGLSHMEAARDLVGQLREAEAQMVGAREQAARLVSMRLQIGVSVAALLVVVLAALSFQINRQQFGALARAHGELQQANVNLVREAAARERVSEQLRQAQKMEAIGQLTGGIAHDFNNMLAIVIGSLNLMRRRLERAQVGELPRLVDGALEGAERAATLTNRLLAFSRQQALKPEPIDPNKFVAGMSELLRRSLGESIKLETVLAGGLWRSHADANQLENALLNLCINARDAMPEGGKLTIETLNAYLDEAYAAEHIDVPAGQYVLIAVTDTGGGMTPEIIAKAFDPFFSTKAVGQGTGLGLSQVYGFVKQSGGHVKIYSELGQGTSVKLYLPRFTGSVDVERPAPVEERAQGSPGELVLVVEDEDNVRKLTVEMLRELGYSVAHADGATAALRALDANPATTLLFTDIVMPDINGRKLADEATRRHPHLKVLYTTGYTRNAIVHNGVLDQGVHLISKPFTLDQVASKLREVLDAK
jgi:signal transduction histidine kinase/ActR/RegA family two-component response regulator